MKLFIIALSTITLSTAACADPIKAGADDYYACYIVAYNLNIDSLESTYPSQINQPTIYKVADRAVETCNDLFIENGQRDFNVAESGMRRFFEAVRTDS
ncbi:hypothetical protein N5C81_26815, partial [Rhizobium pusense]|uniref:hypothetical protein n=1 Tax=Agrobacterium pusense TaxID=648995 RepID=UPI00244CC135